MEQREPVDTAVPPRCDRPMLPTRTSVLDPSFASRVAVQFRPDADSEGSDADGDSSERVDESSQRRALNQEILAAGVARSMGTHIDRASARTVLPAIIESARRLVSDGSES